MSEVFLLPICNEVDVGVMITSETFYKGVRLIALSFDQRNRIERSRCCLPRLSALGLCKSEKKIHQRKNTDVLHETKVVSFAAVCLTGGPLLRKRTKLSWQQKYP